MAVQAQVDVDITYIVSELGARIRTLENKYNLLGERLLIVNQNMIEEYKKLIKELRMINADIREMKADVANVKETANNIVKEMENFAKKEQIKVLEKYIDLWNPLNFVTEEQLNERLTKRR